MEKKADNKQQRIGGTREWAVAEINCSLGCPHGCRYCYARYDQVERRALATDASWRTPVDLEKDTEPGGEARKYPGRVMFPSQHDIVTDNLDSSIRLLRQLLAAGNDVLVVSKPHLDVITRLCREFPAYRRKILFRFTITARNQEILSFWEPYAPLYPERMQSLAYAFEAGFATSVSVEPMLDTGDVVAMVFELLPFVTDTIWLGKMNKIESRVILDCPATAREVARIGREQEDAVIQKIYRELQGVSKIRWKESIKQVVGLEYAPEPGMDI